VASTVSGLGLVTRYCVVLLMARNNCMGDVCMCVCSVCTLGAGMGGGFGYSCIR